MEVNSVVFPFSNNIECLNPTVSEVTLLHSLLSATVAVSIAVTVPFTSHCYLEFLFDISIYKNLIDKDDLNNILINSFQIALVDSEDKVKAIKILSLNSKLYERFNKVTNYW